MQYNILDVTLRDGSYEVDFKFSCQDLIAVGKALQSSGIKRFEIGHGQGLNASNPRNGVALCSDEEYLSAAAQNLSAIEYGTFCIPGIARVSDIDLLAKYNASFVRIGCNTTINDVKSTSDFISRAKDLGLTVFSNFMKTYVADFKQFEQCVKLSESYGADYLVIVDSAGCMFPEDIKAYYDIIKNSAHRDIKVGFHGHDNLGLAVANSLYALSIGCDVVDASLQSLGRGAGNASTEQILAIFQKKYGVNSYQLAPLMQFSESYLRSRVKFKGVSGLDTYCGIAGFHSGYMNSVRKFAELYCVNPYSLIVEYCKHDRIGMNEALLEKIAQSLSR